MAGTNETPTAGGITIGGVAVQTITIGGSPVNIFSFGSEGPIWTKPLGNSSLTVAKDANIQSVSITRTSLTGATESTTTSSASQSYSNWLHYGDDVTFTATPATATNTRETQTVTGTQTISDPISDTRTTTDPISDSRTTSEGITDYRTETSATTDYRTETSGVTDYQTVTTTQYQTVTSTQSETGTSSYGIGFNGNGSNYGSTSTVYGTSYTQRDRPHYSYQSRPHYSYQSRSGTHYSYQSRPGTHYSYQSRTGTRYYYQSRTGTRYYNQSRTGTRYYDQSRDVYQERTKTRAFSIDSWSGDVSGSTATVSLSNVTAGPIEATIAGTYSDSYTAWADYDYGSWSTYDTRDSWGEWTTDSTSDSWNSWTTDSTSDSWNSWSEYSSENKDWGNWSEYSSENKNWGGWSEYSSGDGSWSEYSSGNGDWGGWYVTSYGSATLPSCGYVKFLYNFDYWSMGSTSGAAVSPGGTYSGPTTGYAHWHENKEFSNYNSNGIVRVYEDTAYGGIDSVYVDLFARATAGSSKLYSISKVSFYTSSGSLIVELTPAMSGRIITSGNSKTISSWSSGDMQQLYSYSAAYAIMTYSNGTDSTLTLPVEVRS